MPLRNALSRSHERRADRFALTMTRNLEAFVTAMKRLAAQNLAEEEPSRSWRRFFTAIRPSPRVFRRPDPLSWILRSPCLDST